MHTSRRGEVDPFIAMQVMEAAWERERTHGDVLHLEIGQPSTPAPSGVLDAARAALSTDRLGYTGACGIPELRARIARYYGEAHDLDVAPEEIMVTAGASGAFVLSVTAAFDHGDRVGLALPGYPAYRSILQALGCEVVGVPAGAEEGYVVRPEVLEPLLPLAGLVVASPSNPTGAMLSAADLATLTAWCEANDVRLISDEIYHGLTYEAAATTALASSRRALVVQSFSKYYSMTGWRLGWAVVPAELRQAVERLAMNLYISPTTLSQLAAVTAFDCTEELEANVARYAANRGILHEALVAGGLDRIAPPDGAFYLWVDVADLGVGATTLSRRWLEELGVAVTPGVDFDPVGGERYVRLSYSESTADITEAARRIGAWLTRAAGPVAGPAGPAAGPRRAN